MIDVHSFLDFKSKFYVLEATNFNLDLILLRLILARAVMHFFFVNLLNQEKVKQQDLENDFKKFSGK